MKRREILLKNVRRLSACVLIAVVLVVVEYLLGNLSVPVYDDTDTLKTLHTFRQFFHSNEDLDYYPVNVALDTELVPVVDTDSGFEMGELPVTSRDKLTKILSLAGKARCVFMDIRITDGLPAPGDSALFSQILKMDNVIIPMHEDDDYGTLPKRLLSKAAYADYRIRVGRNFSRYELLQSRGKSVAERMYEMMDSDSVVAEGIGYYDRGRLCLNSFFVRFPVNASLHDNIGDAIRYPYLGSQLLAIPDSLLTEMMADKVVLIGDFDNDVHDTYVGGVPGPLVSYYAYKGLQRGDHIVKLFPTLLLVVIYTLILMTLFWPISVPARIQKHPVLRWLTVILGLIGYNGLMILIEVLYFNLWGIMIICAIPLALVANITLIRNVRREAAELRREANESR